MKTKSVSKKVKTTTCGGWIHPYMKNYTGYCFYKLAMRFRSIVDEELESHQVVAPQFGILAMLNEVGSMTQVELGNYMAIDKASMVRLLDGLEKQGYLVRGNLAGDRRAKVLEITKAGKKAAIEMREARIRAEKKFFSPLSAKDQALFKEILLKMADGILITK